MEYGSTPYIGMAPKKNGYPTVYVQTALDLVISFCGLYLSFSSIFNSNKTLTKRVWLNHSVNPLVCMINRIVNVH